MSYSIKPLEGSGQTVLLIAGVPFVYALTDRELMAGQFILQIPTAVKVMVTWGDPAPVPNPATPGTPRRMGAGVWFEAVDGLTMSMDMPPGTPNTEVEIFFGTGIRTQNENVSYFGGR